MAYKTTVALSCANRQVALDELWTQLVAMGWTLVDGSCTPVTVAYTAVSVANDTFTAVGHTFVDGQPVRLTCTGTAPGGLTKDTTLYYVRNISGNDFKLSTTYNGAAVNITSQGTGNHTICEAYRVYSSNGESGVEITQYIRIFMYLTTTSIQGRATYAWDLTAHAPLGEASSSYPMILTTNETGFTFWIYGDKDTVWFAAKISTTFTRGYFGFGIPFLPLRTALTAGASTGDNAILTVTDTSEFEINSLYQIVGASAEGRDQVTVTSITDSTHMVVANLPRDYASGAYIGDVPCLFGHSRASTYWAYFYYTCPARIAGLAEGSSYSSATINALFDATSIDPDDRTGKYTLIPLTFNKEAVNVNSAFGTGGRFSERVLQMHNTGVTSEDTFGVLTRDSGTSSGSNDATTLNDTTKSWGTNAFADKVLIITFGIGIGQLKKITSNTSTALTLAAGYTFSIVPNATSQYIICEKGYRYLDTAGVTGMAMVHQEGV